MKKTLSFRLFFLAIASFSFLCNVQGAQPGVDVTMPSDTVIAASSEASSGEESINDPLEPINRFFFAINRLIDGMILKPVAIVYSKVLPEPVQNGVGNFIQNLASPIYFVNHILQGNPQAAATTVLRVLMNTTMGLGGILDAGAELGFPETPTGFGDTLGVWGVDTGPYLMIPVIGPSSFRGASGFVADYYTNPFTYYFNNKHHRKERWIKYTLTGLETVNSRSKVLTALDDLEKNSADYYAAIRSIYFQQQKYKVNRLKSGQMVENRESQSSTGVTESPSPSQEEGKAAATVSIEKVDYVTESPRPS